MNLEEVKKIEEAMFAGIRGMLSGQGKQQTKVQDIFIKDFMQDAMASINNGFAGEFIELPQKNSGATATPPAAPGASPATPSSPTSPTGGAPTPTAAPKAGTTTPTTPTTPTAPKAGTTTPPTAPAAKPGTPTAPAAAPKAGATTPAAPGSPIFTGAPQRAEFTQAKMDLRSAIEDGPDWSRLSGIDSQTQRKMIDNIVRNGSTAQQEIEQYLKNNPSSVRNRTTESSYRTLNKIFESIINIDEQAEKMPLADYLMNWFSQYMQGVAWEGSKPLVKTKIDALAKDYPNNLKQNLQKLAQTALALSKAASPAGAPKEFTQMRQASGQEVQQGYEEIKAALDELAKINPDLYNKFIKTLRPVAAQPGASAGLVEQKKRK